MVNEVAAATDNVLTAAGSMPGDLHKLWRARDPRGYHVEYGYSCMGYEIAGGLGAKLAAPDREVFVLVDNHGFASIGGLSQPVGSQRFGTSYQYRGAAGRLDGGYLPVDLAANAESLGVDVRRAGSIDEFRAALLHARAADHITLVRIETDPLIQAPDGGAWWDVPVAATAALQTTRDARAAYESAKRRQHRYL